MNIHKNDMVMVVKGKDRGKRGRVQRILPRLGLVVIEGLNVISRHTKGRPGVRQSGIIKREAPLDVSKVVFICPQCNKPARVKDRRLETGAKARVCNQCQEVIE